ncbi:MAG: ATP-dependent sacrificial sulfur transferase LarE [Treponema sp.]|nr:ATP-dependent sacrificial sulfur transferase LarE [Treponema sp.]
MTEQLNTKYESLQNYFKQLGSVAIAFSSGVDSTFMLKVAHDVLGSKVVAITVRSPLFPAREKNEASDFCKDQSIEHIFIESDELNIPGFKENPKNRCYLCKRELFEKIINVAKEHGLAHVCEGSNLDDNGDYRPGLKAIAELGVKSPLRECNLWKSEIRAISKELGLPTWKKPSFACLASRFVYGENITAQKLEMVDKAEQLLLELGFVQERVRIHSFGTGETSGTIARIEVNPDEFSKLVENREKIVNEFKQLGFNYVSMDLHGYRTGSMNETLLNKDNISIILSDLDGTLFHNDRTISDYTKNVIRQVQAKGILFGVCTARAKVNALRFLDGIEPDILISNGGGLITYRGQKIYNCEFSIEETHTLINKVFEVFGEGTIISADNEAGVFSNSKEELGDRFWNYNDFSNFGMTCMKLCIESLDKEKVAEVANLFGEGKIDFLPFSDIPWYKLTKIDATKEKAIEALCKYLDVPVSKVAAFGDDFNDIGMLKLCGKGIATDNAIAEVKQAADEVCLSNEEDGVAKWMEKTFGL